MGFGRLGKAHLQFLHRVYDCPGNEQARGWFIVGGDDVPGSAIGAGGADAFLVSLHVLVPMLAFLNICNAEFPIFFGPVQAFEKALSLFFFRDVEKELDDASAVIMEMAFESDNGTIALIPDIIFVQYFIRQAFAFENLRMHAQDQDFFVIGTVEDADASALGEGAGCASEEIMFEFLDAGMLETDDLATLRIDAGHDVLDGAVLAGGIHGL